MMSRVLTAVVAAVAGVALAAAMPELPRVVRQAVGLPALPAAQSAGATAATGSPAHGRDDGHGHGAHEEEHGEGKIPMTADQVAAAGIAVAAVKGGVLVSRFAVPGTLTANADRLARVTARVGGVVAEVRKRLGEPVEAGDVLAVVESREIAEAKSEYLAAGRTAQLANVTLSREQGLWRQRISAEQDLLQARATAEEARIRLDLARQKLSSLGMADAEVAALARQPTASLRRLEVRAPIAGRVTARAAVLGAAVTADAEIFSVANLSTLWVEMTIPPRDLTMVREGQAVTVSGEGGAEVQGKIVFLSPVLDSETRAARAVAEIGNAEGTWRAGAFATVHLTSDEQAVDVMVPRDAVQEIEGEKVVFVRTEEGFERRDVAVGREDASAFEVIFGLDAGTEIAVGNAFVLRSELGKSEAGHSH